MELNLFHLASAVWIELNPFCLGNVVLMESVEQQIWLLSIQLMSQLG